MPGFAPIIDPESASVMAANPTPVIPPVPGGDLTPEQLASAAVPKPVAFPDNPVDEVIANNPLPVTPPVEAPKTPVEQAARNVEEAKAIGDEQTAAAKEKAAIETQLAEESAKFKVAHAEALQKVTDAQAAHRREAETAVTEARAKAEGQEYHTLWESRTNAQKAAIGFGLILNGISWNPNHVNRGVQMLEDATKNDFEIQRAKHGELWKAVDEAQQGLRDLDQSQLRELSAFSANEAARYDAIAGRLSAAAAANKGRGDVAAIRKTALEYNEKANTAWQNSITAAAQAAHLERSDAERARHDKENELLRKKKLGGGVGAGSPALQENAVKLREEIEAAQNGKEVKDSKGNVINPGGKPLTGGQIDRRALELKIPPVAKAGRVSVKTILDNIKEGAAINKADVTLSDKEENTIVKDGNGNAIGRERSAKLASQATKDYINRTDAAKRMEELAEDIHKYGAKVDPTDQKAVQRRVSKFANAIIGIGIVSPLGKTNETLHLETKALGIPGVVDWEHLTDSLKNYVLSAGANEENVRAKVEETRHNRDSFARSLIQLSDEEKKKYSRGAESQGKWIPIPSYLADKEKLKGKKEIQVNASGDVIGAR